MTFEGGRTRSERGARGGDDAANVRERDRERGASAEE